MPAPNIATIVVPLAAVAITASTPVTIHTPQTGRRIRVLGYAISATVASIILLKTGGTERIRLGSAPINNCLTSPPMGHGLLLAVDAPLQIDATVTTNVSGYILVREE